MSSHDNAMEEFSRPPEVQQEFAEDVCKLLVTLGIPFNIVSHPEYKLFSQKWMPGLVTPDRHTLAGSILNKEADKVIMGTRQHTEGKLATYQCDGWKNIAKTSVITSMMTVDSLSYLLRTHDMSGKPKTGDELFILVKDDIMFMQNTYRVDTIAITTDDGPDGKKM
ncbi:hypothetical protein BDQ17DRAFT_1333968 [Cyathus striatus]|nr:hypothetical protein BDQ17DRAFT_1333968 [Cyathus striatus]